MILDLMNTQNERTGLFVGVEPVLLVCLTEVAIDQSKYVCDAGFLSVLDDGPNTLVAPSDEERDGRGPSQTADR